MQADSCEDSRENTPDSDSGYVGSVVTVTSSSRTFSRPSVGEPPAPPAGAHSLGGNITSPLGANNTPNFLSEMQNVQRRKGLETAGNGVRATPATTNSPGGPSPLSPTGASPLSPTGASPLSPMGNATLADQLRSRLEERRKSKEEDMAQQPLPGANPPAAFVPESIAADIQKAVKMANDTSE